MKNFNKTLAIALFAAATLFSAQSANAQSFMDFEDYEPELSIIPTPEYQAYLDACDRMEIDVDELLEACGSKRLQSKEGKEFDRFVAIMKNIKYHRVNGIQLNSTQKFMGSKQLRSFGCSDSFVRAAVFGHQWLWS